MARVTWQSRSRIAAVLLLCASLLLSGFATDQARAGKATRNRSEMLQLTNEARAMKHRDALELDRQLSKYAVRHSHAMAANDGLFHSADLAALLGGRDWSIGGENVGVASSLDDLQATFMRSPLHRRNILRAAFDHTAIGVVESGGRLWVTIIFYG